MQRGAEGEVVHSGEVDDVSLHRDDVPRYLTAQREPRERALVAHRGDLLGVLHMFPERRQAFVRARVLRPPVQGALGDHFAQLEEDGELFPVALRGTNELLEREKRLAHSSNGGQLLEDGTHSRHHLLHVRRRGDLSRRRRGGRRCADRGAPAWSHLFALIRVRRKPRGSSSGGTSVHGLI